MLIYVVILNYWEEGISLHGFEDILVGVFTDKNVAYRAGLKAEVEKNLKHFGDDASDDLSLIEYADILRQFDYVKVFDDSFLNLLTEIREDYLGFAGGYRFKIKETKLDQELVKEFGGT